MALPNKPSIKNVWATSGLKVEPSDTKVNTGWIVERPPHQFQNFLQNRSDQFLKHINEAGIPVWDAVTIYTAGKSYVQGSDGLLYKAKTTGANQDPVGNPTNWMLTLGETDFQEVVQQTEDNALAAANSASEAATSEANALATVPVFDDVAPTPNLAGKQWTSALTGKRYEWIVDADSGQWVEMGPQTTFGATAFGETLIAEDGATKVGTPEGTVQEALDGRVKTRQSYAALMAYSGFVPAQITTPGIAGLFQYNAALPNTTNGGTQFAHASGVGAWERLYDGTILLTWFGAVGNATGVSGVGSDDSAAIEAALSVSTSVNDILAQPGKTYRVTRTLNVIGNKTFRGPDAGSQNFQPAYIYHDSASTGPLFNVTNAASGVCIKNFTVIGGNGSFCISSSNSYVRYEYIRMSAYNGGGIQLLRTGVGSSSSKLINCSWTGPSSATSYTGFEIDVNGGDVWLTGCTAIFGAIGCEIKQGQTIVLDKCSFNKQNIYSGHSNATQFNTAGVKLSGTDYKQAISIRNSYIEACTNGLYVEACSSLSVEDNLFYDAGASGVVGAFIQYGNSAINLGSGVNSKNITIKNNYIESLSNGDATNTFYAVYFGGAENVKFENNYVKTTGSYGAQYNVGTSTTVTMDKNTRVQSGSNVQPDFDPSNRLRFLVIRDSLANTWFDATIVPPATNMASSPVRYRRDAFGFVHLKGGVNGAVINNTLFTLPVGFRPLQQEGPPVNATAGAGAVTIDTAGAVVFRGGTGTYVYFSGVDFSTT